jgi:hypothetical protein
MRGISINGPNFGRRYGYDIKLYKIDNLPSDQYIIIAWREGRRRKSPNSSSIPSPIPNTY